MADESYTKVREYFSSGRNIKQFIKRCEYGLLLELQDKINTAILEWEEELEKEKESQRVRNEKRNELLALIESEGFSAEELITSGSEKGQGKKKAKYEYTVNGRIKKWSGVGRTPKAIQDALNAGKSIDSFLIENKEV